MTSQGRATRSKTSDAHRRRRRKTTRTGVLDSDEKHGSTIPRFTSTTAAPEAARPRHAHVFCVTSCVAKQTHCRSFVLHERRLLQMRLSVIFVTVQATRAHTHLHAHEVLMIFTLECRSFLDSCSSRGERLTCAAPTKKRARMGRRHLNQTVCLARCYDDQVPTRSPGTVVTRGGVTAQYNQPLTVKQ